MYSKEHSDNSQQPSGASDAPSDEFDDILRAHINAEHDLAMASRRERCDSQIDIARLQGELNEQQKAASQRLQASFKAQLELASRSPKAGLPGLFGVEEPGAGMTTFGGGPGGASPFATDIARQQFYPALPTATKSFRAPYPYRAMSPDWNKDYGGQPENAEFVADRNTGLLVARSFGGGSLYTSCYVGVPYTMATPVTPWHFHSFDGPPPFREASISVVATLDGWKRWALQAIHAPAKTDGRLWFLIVPTLRYPDFHEFTVPTSAQFSEAKNARFHWNKFAPEPYGHWPYMDYTPYYAERFSPAWPSPAQLPQAASSNRFTINNYCRYKVYVGLRIETEAWHPFVSGGGRTSSAVAEMRAGISSISIFQYDL